ncbi:MAG: methionine--tRNA ligase [Verrucomicrobiae bacterium]|nr:methionine--tRNA ligase [Verrucomicrobiae bacterium]
MSKRFYITTAIDYVNGEPHLGHAYEKVITDVIARARRSLGFEVFYLTGTDEHGQKVQQAATAENKSPKDYCDDLAVIWKNFAKKLNLSNDDFIRTTDERHKKIVSAFLSKLYNEGHFYKAAYKGFYSTKEETFLTEKDRRPDGTFDPSYGEVIELQEDNYYFKLSPHQRWLIEYIETHPNFIYPDYRRNEVLGFLKNNTLEDLCISRPVNRLNWGIPLPFDKNFVTYVWFDALSNYITCPASHGDATILKAAGLASNCGTTEEIELWPADAHVIGKDIIKFHAVYWPIMLKAMGLPLPEQILVHGWWQKDYQKMSKSTGNVVNPIAVIDEWGTDAFRYYVVRELDIGPDGNWTDTGFSARYNAELANGLGNLINRSLSMLKRYRKGIVPSRANDLEQETMHNVEKIKQSLLQHKLQDALISIWDIITKANQYIDHTAPFKIAKDPSQASRLDQILYTLVEEARILAVLLYPFLPDTASAIYRQLNLEGKPERLEMALWGGMEPGHTVGEQFPLFPKKEGK